MAETNGSKKEIKQQQQQQHQKKKPGFFNVSCGASVLVALYISLAFFNLYKLMFPLTTIDVSSFSAESMIRPLWSPKSELHLQLYLSSHRDFHRNFITTANEFPNEENDDKGRTVTDEIALLMGEKLDSAAFHKSFLLTTCETDECQEGTSYQTAVSWLDQAEHVAKESKQGNIFSAMAAAGQGIESTSFLLTLYNSLAHQMRRLLAWMHLVPPAQDDDMHDKDDPTQHRTIVRLPRTSTLWSSFSTNSTNVYLYALLVRTDQPGYTWPPTTRDSSDANLRKASQRHALLLGQVDMVKYDKPHHIRKPGRILFHDLVYLFRKYTNTGTTDAHAPWDMAYSKPTEHAQYQTMLDMKQRGAGYPYWKPEVAIKLINEEDSYPREYAGLSGMPVVRIRPVPPHPTGLAFTPAMHVDEIGLTSEKYIPVNETLTALPLRISFDRSDVAHAAAAAATAEQQATATAGGMSPARWRLLSHLSGALEDQKEMGFQQEDIDDVRRLIADTNVTLLAITVLFSALHMLFEFLTFKSDVSFWNNNQDLTGLSVRSLFLDMIGQAIILLFLIEKESSLLMTVPSGIGCLIALWKCRRAAGLQFRKLEPGRPVVAWWNFLPSLVGYELRAIRLELPPNKEKATDGSDNKKKQQAEVGRTNLAQVTIEADRIATKTLGSVLLPLVVGYAIYSFIYQEHTGWYSWLVTSASTAVYALGFVLMTPQLFLNWKLKSVAHLPWRVLVYKSLNTFIDDLFSFIIRMPTMARISCFRDDVVFFIYLYQRWLYPVDTSRPMEGGGEMEKNGSTAAATETKKKQ